MLAVFPGEWLADIYHEYGARLLELNVRSFLQATGKVNRGIRDTLRDEPERFLAYNNGISATASEVTLVELPDGGRGIAAIRDLQIVNGGQTTASIHRAQRDRRRSLRGRRPGEDHRRRARAARRDRAADLAVREQPEQGQRGRPPRQRSIPRRGRGAVANGLGAGDGRRAAPDALVLRARPRASTATRCRARARRPASGRGRRRTRPHSGSRRRTSRSSRTRGTSFPTRSPAARRRTSPSS